MDFQIILLLVIAMTLIISLLSKGKTEATTVTVELYLASFEKNKYETPEVSATCSKQCALAFLPEKGMDFDAAGIGPASICRVIASDTYFPKILCELSLSRSNGDFEDALRILKEEKWRIKTI